MKLLSSDLYINCDNLIKQANILYEIVEKDQKLALCNFDFDDEDEDSMVQKFCDEHIDRVKHFYCSNHKTIFCRECIKQFHSDDECFVVDLYEI